MPTSEEPRARGEGTLCVPHVSVGSPTPDGRRWCRRFQFYFNEPTPTLALGRAVREHVERDATLAAAHAGVPDERLAELSEMVVALDDECLKRHGFWPLSDWELQPTR